MRGHIDRETPRQTIDAACIDAIIACSRIDAACIDFDGRQLTNDAASINAESERSGRIARAQAIDAACIDAEAFASPIDESRIDRESRRQTIDAACIDASSPALESMQPASISTATESRSNVACIDAGTASVITYIGWTGAVTERHLNVAALQ